MSLIDDLKFVNTPLLEENTETEVSLNQTPFSQVYKDEIDLSLIPLQVWNKNIILAIYY